MPHYQCRRTDDNRAATYDDTAEFITRMPESLENGSGEFNCKYQANLLYTVMLKGSDICLGGPPGPKSSSAVHLYCAPSSDI